HVTSLATGLWTSQTFVPTTTAPVLSHRSAEPNFRRKVAHSFTFDDHTTLRTLPITNLHCSRHSLLPHLVYVSRSLMTPCLLRWVSCESGQHNVYQTDSAKSLSSACSSRAILTTNPIT